MTTTQPASPVELEGFRLVKAANEALDRIDATGEDWLIVGEVYMRGRQEAMTEARTNVPKGKRYNRALDDWTARIHFDLRRIDEKTRTALAHIMENRAAFDAWRAALPTNQRQEWNHPRTLWRQFERTRIAKTTPEGSHAGKKPRPTVKEITVELDMVKSQLAKASEGQLLIDLARDSDDNMTRVVLQEPAVLTNPRRFADLFRRWAFLLGEQARKRKPKPDAPAIKPAKAGKSTSNRKRNGQVTEAPP